MLYSFSAVYFSSIYISLSRTISNTNFAFISTEERVGPKFFWVKDVNSLNAFKRIIRASLSFEIARGLRVVRSKQKSFKILMIVLILDENLKAS